MRPVKTLLRIKQINLAELVCSNSLRAGNIENAVGLLKEEMSFRFPDYRNADALLYLIAVP